MCGRFNVISDPLTRLLLSLTIDDPVIQDQVNIAPTEYVPVIRAHSNLDLGVEKLRWWLVPSWVDEPSTRYSMFNARAENLLSSKAFRKPFMEQRCVVPISGYYEWSGPKGEKIPYYVSPEGADGLLLAGLWETWQGKDQTLESFTIVTTEAHDSLRDLHHRMPVMLTHKQLENWLDPTAEAGSLLRFFVPRLPGSLELRPVSTYVNSSRNKGQACLEPIAAPQFIDHNNKFKLGPSKG